MKILDIINEEELNEFRGGFGGGFRPWGGMPPRTMFTGPSVGGYNQYRPQVYGGVQPNQMYNQPRGIYSQGQMNRGYQGNQDYEQRGQITPNHNMSQQTTQSHMALHNNPTITNNDGSTNPASGSSNFHFADIPDYNLNTPDINHWGERINTNPSTPSPGSPNEHPSSVNHPQNINKTDTTNATQRPGTIGDYISNAWDKVNPFSSTNIANEPEHLPGKAILGMTPGEAGQALTGNTTKTSDTSVQQPKTPQSNNNQQPTQPTQSNVVQPYRISSGGTNQPNTTTISTPGQQPWQVENPPGGGAFSTDHPSNASESIDLDDEYALLEYFLQEDDTTSPWNGTGAPPSNAIVPPSMFHTSDQAEQSKWNQASTPSGYEAMKNASAASPMSSNRAIRSTISAAPSSTPYAGTTQQNALTSTSSASTSNPPTGLTSNSFLPSYAQDRTSQYATGLYGGGVVRNSPYGKLSPANTSDTGNINRGMTGVAGALSPVANRLGNAAGTMAGKAAGGFVHSLNPMAADNAAKDAFPNTPSPLQRMNSFATTPEENSKKKPVNSLYTGAMESINWDELLRIDD